MNNHERLEKYARGQGYKILGRLDWAHIAWALDSIALIVEDRAGNRLLLRTIHGEPYIGESAELAAYISRCQGWVAEATKALELLTQAVPPAPLSAPPPAPSDKR